MKTRILKQMIGICEAMSGQPETGGLAMSDLCIDLHDLRQYKGAFLWGVRRTGSDLWLPNEAYEGHFFDQHIQDGDHANAVLCYDPKDKHCPGFLYQMSDYETKKKMEELRNRAKEEGVYYEKL